MVRVYRNDMTTDKVVSKSLFLLYVRVGGVCLTRTFRLFTVRGTET